MKILVIDDHPLILEALRRLLPQLSSAVDVHDARTAEGGKALLMRHPDAALLLLDLSLPGADGFSLLEGVRTQHPEIPVVVLSASDRREDILRALELGAMGYIPKISANAVMLQALQLVLSGGIYLPPIALAPHEAPVRPASAEEVPAAARTTPRDLGLTSRQAQVLALVLQGKPNKDISRELGLSEATVKVHIASILRALNVTTRTQAVIEASRLGLHVETAFSSVGTTARN